MSLHHVGIGTPSPLLRQLSRLSPRSPNPNLNLNPLGISPGRDDADDELSEDDDSGEDAYWPVLIPRQELDQGPDPEIDDLTQDRRDVLVERLGDLARRLQRVPPAAVLDELHAKVDEMEGALRGTGTIPENAHLRRRPLQRSATSSMVLMAGMLRPVGSGPGQGDGSAVEATGALPTPPWQGIAKFDDQPLGTVAGFPREEPGAVSKRVVEEAERLNARLVEAVQSFKARKEESDHIHALLVERAEAAASRILELEEDVAQLEDEITTNESDLRHLRIALRAVETLCHDSLRSGPDPELVQSIENWKADWAKLRDKLAENKKAWRMRRSQRAREHGGDEGESTLLTASLASVSTPTAGGARPVPPSPRTSLLL